MHSQVPVVRKSCQQILELEDNDSDQSLDLEVAVVIRMEVITYCCIYNLGLVEIEIAD